MSRSMVQRSGAGTLGGSGTASSRMMAAIVSGVLARVNALAALGRIGPKAKAAVPELAKLVKDRKASSGVRCQAAIALGQIGPDAKEGVSALAAAAGETPVTAGPLRYHAITALGQIGHDAKGAVPALEKLGKDKAVGKLARQALERIRKEKE